MFVPTVPFCASPGELDCFGVEGLAVVELDSS
jgi:hypothetical protein